MIAINTNGALLPVDKLKAIGIEFARGDSPKLSPKQLDLFSHHYSRNCIWCFPHYSQDDKEAAKFARYAYRYGIRHIEIANEPDGDWWSIPPLSPKDLAERSKRLRDVLPSTVKLYGPSTAIWNEPYISQFLESGGECDVISFHGYWKSLENLKQVHLESLVKFGKLAFNTEVALTKNNPNWKNYPLEGSQSFNFIKAKELLGKLDWTLYNGPVPTDDVYQRVGLFAWNGGNWEESKVYKEIVWQLTSVKSSQ